MRAAAIWSGGALAQARAPLPFRLTTSRPSAGLQFQHNSGAYGGKLLPETLGAGCAFIDYDADGWQDILLVNGMDWPGHTAPALDAAAVPQQPQRHLHRRHRAAPASTSRCTEWASRSATSTTTAFPTSLITCVGQNRLFRNTGKGTFVDVTRASGLGGRPALSTSAVWFDFDRDGLLDLFVCNYVQVVGRPRRLLQPRRQAEVVLHARGVPRRHLLAVPQPRQRHLRRRHGHERHLRHELEIARRVAARLRPGRLARSRRRQRHAAQQALSQPAQRHGSRTSAVEAGLAFSADGKARAGMGVDVGDFDNSGAPGPGDHQLRQRDDRPVSSARSRAVRGRRRRAPGVGAAVAQLARIRLRLRRSRSGRHARSGGRQRPHRRNRPQHPRQRRLRAAAAAVPQPGQRRVPRRRPPTPAATSPSRRSDAAWRAAISIATATSTC